MRNRKCYPIVVVALTLMTMPARAYTNIHIDLSTQTMHVTSSTGSYTWPVSTARAGYVTPRGSFSPKSLQSIHYSQKYDNAPMPHSIFFSGGYASHGSYATGALGSPASHGCVRLSPGHAAQLYRMVQTEGGHISISGTPPRESARRIVGQGRHGRAQATQEDAGPNSLFEIFGN
jgi:hypothetical protein